MDSKMYALPILFEERIHQDQFQYARVRRVGGIKSYQRRDCYRFPCTIPITVERLWQHERKKHPEQQSTEGQMINFSDGGMLFATNEDIEKDEKLTLTFDMGRTETIEGVAVRTKRVSGENFKYNVAIQFRHTKKDKSQKQRFYKYIVDKQMEARRRQIQDIKPLYPAKTE